MVGYFRVYLEFGINLTPVVQRMKNYPGDKTAQELGIKSKNYLFIRPLRDFKTLTFIFSLPYDLIILASA